MSLIDIIICDMCYLEEYICAYKEYYYRAKLTDIEKKQFNTLFYNKLPYPFYYKSLKHIPSDENEFKKHIPELLENEYIR